MCNHDRTEISHKVFRLTEGDNADGWRLEIKLKCLDCFTPFTFKTPCFGVMPFEATTGYDRSELRVPLVAPNPESNN